MKQTSDMAESSKGRTSGSEYVSGSPLGVTTGTAHQKLKTNTKQQAKDTKVISPEAPSDDIVNPLRASYTNLANGSNSNEGSGGYRRKNRIPDTGEPNSIQSNKPRTTVKKYGPNGKVQKEFNKGHSGDTTPKKEKKDHMHDYKPNPNNQTGNGTRLPGRAPKKNELKKDFGL